MTRRATSLNTPIDAEQTKIEKRVNRERRKREKKPRREEKTS
jgi:hypothetical protein